MVDVRGDVLRPPHGQNPPHSYSYLGSAKRGPNHIFLPSVYIIYPFLNKTAAFSKNWTLYTNFVTVKCYFSDSSKINFVIHTPRCENLVMEVVGGRGGGMGGSYS